jgi:hypothetical protein
MAIRNEGMTARIIPTVMTLARRVARTILAES